MTAHERVINDSRVTVKEKGWQPDGLFLRLWIFTPDSTQPMTCWSCAQSTKKPPSVHQGEKEAADGFDLKCKEHDLKPINRF